MGLARPTVLVVEDDEAIREMVTECLRDEGHRVIAAGGLDAALAALATARIDAIITDADLAGGGDAPDLWHAPERLRAAAPGVPIVISSAYPPHVFADHRARGFAGTLPKPFDLDALVAVIERCLSPR